MDKIKIGILGLGRMGYNLALNLMDKGHEVVAYNRSRGKVEDIEKEGATGAYSLEEFSEKLGENKVVWLMVPAGDALEEVMKNILPYMREGDLLVDGGNSYYKDSIEHGQFLNEKGILFLDVGTSGGIEGARNGACYMVGGDKKAYDKIEDIFRDTSVENGYGYFGKAGAGHFVKMIHNGIEYGMMQAMGEGFEVVEKSEFNDGIDKRKLSQVWNNGSVIRSWLVELIERAYSNDIELEKYTGAVGLSGEGEWTVKTAKELNVPVPVIEESVNARFRSMKEPRYQGKVVQALRYEFGGHNQPK